MADNPNPQNAKPTGGKKDDKGGQNRGDASDTSNRAGQRASTQQGGASGTADNAGAVNGSRGEHERLTRTSHEEKS